MINQTTLHTNQMKPVGFCPIANKPTDPMNDAAAITRFNRLSFIVSSYLNSIP